LRATGAVICAEFSSKAISRKIWEFFETAAQHNQANVGAVRWEGMIRSGDPVRIE
jgi:hypothetical protein